MGTIPLKGMMEAFIAPDIRGGKKMPYQIRKAGNKFTVVKADDGKVMGTHPSRTKARAQLRALYANEANKSGATKQAMTRDEVMALIQDLHDIAMELGATCGAMAEEDTPEEEGTETPEEESAEVAEGEGDQGTPEVGTEEYASGTAGAEQARASRDEMNAQYQEQQARVNEAEPGTEPRPGYSRNPRGGKSASLQDKTDSIRQAWVKKFDTSSPLKPESSPGWIQDVLDDGVVVSQSDGLYLYPYVISPDGSIVFGTPAKVKREYLPAKGLTINLATMRLLCPDCATEMERKGFKSIKWSALKAGNVSNMAEHMKKKLGGDPNFFTKCMEADETAKANDREALCARLHKEVTGIWPAQHEGKSVAFKHPGHDDQSVHDPTKGKGGGGDDMGLSKVGEIPRGGNNLKWKAEDTITGDLTITTPDDFDIGKLTSGHAAEYIRTNASDLIPGIGSGEDLDEIKITGLERGKGFVRVKVDITPSEEAGADWASESASTTRRESQWKGGVSVNYIKSLHVSQPEQFFRDVVAVKSVGKDTVRGYLALWGDPDTVDIESEFFTGAKSPIGATDFWDKTLSLPRPLTWSHAQDKATKQIAQVGALVELGDDDIGRWYVAQLDLSHRYRKAIDKLISQRAIGTSSDSAPQYVIRQPVSKGATWLKQWPLFAAALTTTPCEPRQIGSVDYFKSLGIDLGELALGTEAAQLEARRAEIEKRVQSLKQKERLLKLYV